MTNENLEGTLGDFKEMLTAVCRELRREMREGFTAVNARLDRQTEQLDEQILLIDQMPTDWKTSPRWNSNIDSES